MIERCKSCGKFSTTTTENYKNFDLVNDLQWLRSIARVKQKEIQKDQQVKEHPGEKN